MYHNIIKKVRRTDYGLDIILRGNFTFAAGEMSKTNLSLVS